MRTLRKSSHLGSLALALCGLAMATRAQAQEVFQFYGYGRAGISTTGNGGLQYNYGSGASGHYVGRLGDETDTYAELGAGKKFSLDGNQTIQVNTMVSYQTNNGAQLGDYQSYTEPGSNTSQGDISLRQFNIVARGFLGDPGAALWAGKRYYKRSQVEIMDLFYLNNSGYGAGIEDVNVGFGKFSAAWIANQVQGLTGKPNIGGQPYVQINNLDLRLEEISLTPTTHLAFTAILGRGNPNGVQRNAGEPNQSGSFFTGEFQWKPQGGQHAFVAQYALHAMSNFAWINQSGEEVQQTYPNWGGDLQNSTRLILYGEQNLVSSLGMYYSLLHATGETTSTTSVAETHPFRSSLVIAPVLHENDWTSTILEFGGEKFREATQDITHNLTKLMLAQEVKVAKGSALNLRLRAYVGAFFGSEAGANVAVNPNGDRGNIRFGIQMNGVW
jgi:maltoporin